MGRVPLLGGRVMNYAILAAAGLSAFALVLHLFATRGQRPPSPLSESEDETRLRADAWFGRHAITALILLMAATYLHSARTPDSIDLATWVSTFALAIAGLKVIASLRGATSKLAIGEWGWMTLAAGAALFGLAS